MEVVEAISICTKNYITVYPIKKGRNWYVIVNIKGKENIINKPVTEKQINDKDQSKNVLVLTYKHYANKIINQKKQIK